MAAAAALHPDSDRHSQAIFWSHAEVVAADPILQHKHLYLNVPFFMGRAIFYFAGWYLFAHFMNKWSHEQDAGGGDPARGGCSCSAGPGSCFTA